MGFSTMRIFLLFKLPLPKTKYRLQRGIAAEISLHPKHLDRAHGADRELRRPWCKNADRRAHLR